MKGFAINNLYYLRNPAFFFCPVLNNISSQSYLSSENEICLCLTTKRNGNLINSKIKTGENNFQSYIRITNDDDIYIF